MMLVRTIDDIERLVCVPDEATIDRLGRLSWDELQALGVYVAQRGVALTAESIDDWEESRRAAAA